MLWAKYIRTIVHLAAFLFAVINQYVCGSFLFNSLYESGLLVDTYKIQSHDNAASMSGCTDTFKAEKLACQLFWSSSTAVLFCIAQWEELNREKMLKYWVIPWYDRIYKTTLLLWSISFLLILFFGIFEPCSFYFPKVFCFLL